MVTVNWDTQIARLKWWVGKDPDKPWSCNPNWNPSGPLQLITLVPGWCCYSGRSGDLSDEIQGWRFALLLDPWRYEWASPQAPAATDQASPATIPSLPWQIVQGKAVSPRCRKDEMNPWSRVLAMAKITPGNHNWSKCRDQTTVGWMIPTDACTTQLLHPKLEECG